jgi:predicted DNA-binding antitoxin AbrB/MazE fold protein
LRSPVELAESSGYTKGIAVVETAMIQIVEAVFDGTMLHPTVPLDLEAGTRVRITVESVSSETPTNPKSFLQTAQSLHYLYGDAAQENG